VKGGKSARRHIFLTETFELLDPGTHSNYWPLRQVFHREVEVSSRTTNGTRTL
jgi:hypothetical protein